MEKAHDTFRLILTNVPGNVRIGIRIERFPGRSSKFVEKCHAFFPSVDSVRKFHFDREVTQDLEEQRLNGPREMVQTFFLF